MVFRFFLSFTLEVLKSKIKVKKKEEKINFR